MKYIYENEQKNYQDFASGRVLYNQKGATAFPVRLASEIFLRSKAYLEERGHDGTITIYDPFCGGAYLLTVLGFLHGRYLSRIIASDIDENILNLARRNLALLTTDGLEQRIEEIKNNLLLYGKESHEEALESALSLKALQADINEGLEIECFQADAGKAVACWKKVDRFNRSAHGQITTGNKVKYPDLFLKIDLLKPAAILV